MSNIAIILVSESSLPLARTIARSLSGDEMPGQAGHDECTIYTKNELGGCTAIGPYGPFLKAHWQDFDAVIFIGALGICVRSIAPALQNKYRDPAVVCIDSTGKFVVPVVSGHVGGANDLARRLAAILGAQAIVTTQSDNEGLWPIDTLDRCMGWPLETSRSQLNRAVFAFVEKKPTALLLEMRDAGTDYLERTCPPHVKVFYRREEMDLSGYALLIAVTPRQSPAVPEGVAVLAFHPKVLHLGIGCRRQCNPDGIPGHIESAVRFAGFSPQSIAGIGTIELKKEEPRVEFFETFAGKMLLKKATIADVSKMANVPVEMLIEGLEEIIARIEAQE